MARQSAWAGLYTEGFGSQSERGGVNCVEYDREDALGFYLSVTCQMDHNILDFSALHSRSHISGVWDPCQVDHPHARVA
jgi:hypothetical protein